MSFGHFRIVILDEEDLPIRSSVRETVIAETFLAAQFDDLIFRRQAWDRGLNISLSVTIMLNVCFNTWK